jgi:hypothetical protein
VALAGKITRADLAGWTDPQAVMTEVAYDDIPDPNEQCCPWHREQPSLLQVTVIVTTARHLMISACCRPCGESILAALHGTPWTDVRDPGAVLQAAGVSIGMAKILGIHRASVTELRPRDSER